MLRPSSLYFLLIVAIISSVVVVMYIDASANYHFTKRRIIAEMEERSNNSIQSLQKNIADHIEAYAVNEYLKLIHTEIHQQNHFAIIVHDYNMGEIMGEKAFINGSLRTPTGELTEYRPSDPDQRRMLRDCFHVDEAEITNHNGKTIGSIAIYITDKAIQGELRSIIIHTLTNSFAITLLLILALSITLRRLIVDPLTQVAQGIAHCDKDGIPLAALPEQGPIEIRRLSHSVNRMISAIKSSRTALRQQRQQLKEQRDRFQLAVEGTRDGLWDWDLATDHVYHSPRFETMLGYEVGELPNDIRCWSELLHPDDKEQAMKNVEQHLQKRGDEIYESTFRMRTKSGEWRWITGRGKALFSTSGEPIRFVGFNSDVTERIEHQKALEYSAKHDELTGLPNRFLFGELIQNAMHRCQRSNRLLAILYIDLDGFKTVNDTHGHDAGDEVLRESARRMQETLRQEDVVARIGGDEFVIAIADLNQRQEVDGLVRRLLRRLGEPTLHRGRDHIVHSLKVSASIGITFYPQQNDIGADALLRQADQAMYTAKESGKNRYDIFNPAQHQRITA